MFFKSDLKHSIGKYTNVFQLNRNQIVTEVAHNKCHEFVPCLDVTPFLSFQL
jgi:hypothetical protein